MASSLALSATPATKVCLKFHIRARSAPWHRLAKGAAGPGV